MRRMFVVIPLVVALVVLAAPAAASPSGGGVVTLDQVLARNAAARGRIADVRALRTTGHVVFGGGDFHVEADFSQVYKRGGMVRTEATLQGLTQVQAYDGRIGWSVEPFGGRTEPDKASEDATRGLAQMAEWEGPLIDWRAKGHRIELLGTEDVDGTAAIKLRVTRKDGDVQYLFLDPDTALEIRVQTVHKVRGTEQIQETDLGSYQQVGGIWMPYQIESGGKGGPKGLHVTIKRIEVNPAGIDDAWFRLPKPGVRVARVIVEGPPDKSPPSTVPTIKLAPAVVDSGTVSGVGARNIGSAATSGRIAAVAAHQRDGKTTIFVGAASGGVWRSTDGGTQFEPVFDKQPVQSIGAIAIDPTNPRIVWVGTGESWTRNSVSIGNGIYRTTDAGETWSYLGLPNSERIVRIVVHPKTGSTVYACVPGKLWSDSADRGLYKTTDAGRTWRLVLRGANLSTGCSSVAMDPKNPEVLIAGMWDFRRKGWTFRSGGDGPNAASASGMFRSTDGGRSWARLAAGSHRGLPAGPWGRVEIAIAPSNPKIVYALVESKDSALYRSDDGGATWDVRDKSQQMVWRPFYFARLVVDPRNPDRIFKPDGTLIVSTDGGRTFAPSGGGSHGDWHDLWVDPTNPKHVIGGDDGGLFTSFDGGVRWHKANNLPVSQFYHVTVDNKDPYQVYGGLQDNQSWVGDSAYGGGISNARWENLGGGDGFWVVVDPTDPNAVYFESQGGYISRIDRRTMSARDIQPKPGYKEKLRFNWNTPIHASPTQKGTIYIGAQYLFRSRDRGDSWQRISPDLTTNDPQKQKQEESGGVTVDNSSAEMHTTIYTIAESPRAANVIWVGTDDGNLQLTRNGGGKWTNLTPNIGGLPANSWVSWVEASRHAPGTAYATFDRHTYGDMTPWAYRTTDYGKTWTRIAGPDQGIRGYAHVIKEDVVEKNLLFLGTELGMWISVDGGRRWAEFKGGDFPSVAVRDLAIQPRDHDLVIGTHGRGIWIIDDITPLRALANQATLEKSTAFLPARPIQQRLSMTGGGVEGDATFVGANPPGGAVITYYLRSRHIYGEIKLEILDAAGKVVETLSPTKHRGINRVSWSMRAKAPRVPKAAQLAFSAAQGPRVLPGSYTVRLTRGSEVTQTKLAIGLDRRAPYNAVARKAQYETVMRAYNVFEDMTKTVDQLDALREAVGDRAGKILDSDPLFGKLKVLDGKLEAAKKLVVATTEGGAITGEERIREHLDQVYGAVNGWEGRPAKYQVDHIEALRKELADVTAVLRTLATKDARALDAELRQHKLEPLPAISQLVPRPAPLDRIARACIESRGADCGGDRHVAAERD